MTSTTRYTATLPLDYVNELKELAKEKVIPSINFAVTEAVREYIKAIKYARYEASMKEAVQDEAFLARTLKCAEDFKYVDAEVSGEW